MCVFVSCYSPFKFLFSDVAVVAIEQLDSFLVISLKIINKKQIVGRSAQFIFYLTQSGREKTVLKNSETLIEGIPK